uniref:GPI ethanolamine phosphate transferase 3 n=1 Tax=Haemonchus contortus TaxID=6289 RepID=A0A7I4XSH3_HAECO
MRLLLLSLSFIFSLLIFQSGFLLKRKELHMHSKCSDAKLLHSECWMQRQFRKVVVLLVDALRYDFLLPLDENAPQSFFRGQMPGVTKLMNRGGRIGLFLADPPTTTLQRIKALTTGTLPTFIDAGENFAPSPNINEDNVLFQAKSRNLSVTFMGDDTWTSLYPNAFTKTYPFDSFDINDLNSVDDAVRELLREEMRSPHPSDLVIAHILGVDHCGHKHGPNHFQMADILRKTDNIIMETANALSNDDLLIVMGDHGMTTTGDHGGESDDEVHAGLLIFSPGKKFPPLPDGLFQIDIVPTLSLLLGLPIPFSNLGIVIESLFPTNLTEQAIALNYEQVRRFATSYAAANPSFEISEIILHDTTVSGEQLGTIRRLQASLRAAWTQFDITSMRLGMFCFIDTLLFLFSSRPLSTAQSVVRSGCLLLQLSVIFGGTNGNPAVSLLLVVLPISVLTSAIPIISNLFSTRPPQVPLLFAYTCVFLHSVSFLSNSYVVYEGHVLRFLAQSALLVCFADKIVRAPSDRKQPRVSSILAALISRLPRWDIGVFGLALALLRLEPLFHRCREEEVNCQQWFPLELLSSLSSDALFWRFVLATATLFSLNVLVGRVLPDVLPNSLRIARALSWPVHACLTFHHLVRLTPETSVMQRQTQLMGLALAQVVYLCSAIAALLCICSRSSSRSAAYLCLVHTICWPLFLLLGDGLQPSLVAFLFILYACIHLCDAAVLPPLFAILIPLGFYLTGHSPTIPAIPWHAAFIGLPGNFPYRIVPAILVMSHIAMSAIIVPLVIPLHPFTNAESLYSLVGFSAIPSLFSCIAATIHKRHLMVWKIFAPRFIFESFLFIYFLCVSNLVLFICKRMKLL